MTDNANVMEKNEDTTDNSDANNTTAPVDQTLSTDKTTMGAADNNNITNNNTTTSASDNDSDVVKVIATKSPELSEEEKEKIDNLFASQNSEEEDNQKDSNKSPKNKDNNNNTKTPENKESTNSNDNTSVPVVDLVEDDTLGAVSHRSSRLRLSRRTKTYMPAGAHVKLIVEQKEFRRKQAYNRWKKT